MTIQERYKNVLEYFLKHNPKAETELNYENPYQLLVAVILSAQCTDKRVNSITPAVFKRFPTPQAMAQASFQDLFPLIKSVSYPNNKTKYLIGMAQALINNFNGIVPSDVEQLQKLPGVGRKTANVIAACIFNQPKMAVDTHVFRVSARIGLTRGAKTTLQAEQQLIRHIPTDMIPLAHHWLILHGRYICIARHPKCWECGIREWCRYYKQEQKEKVSKQDKKQTAK